MLRSSLQLVILILEECQVFFLMVHMACAGRYKYKNKDASRVLSYLLFCCCGETPRPRKLTEENI